MRLPSTLQDICKLLLLIQILKKKIILSLHAVCYILPFAERYDGGKKNTLNLVNISTTEDRSSDEVHEQLGVTALHDLSECPCADRMVLFQACVAWLYMWNFVVERKLMFLKITIDGAAVFVYNGPSGIVIHFIFNSSV